MPEQPANQRQIRVALRLAVSLWPLVWEYAAVATDLHALNRAAIEAF